MDPEDFCLLAEELVKGSRPVEYRTAISRAYYSVYNQGRNVFHNLGIKIKEGPNGHGELQRKLSNSGDPEIIGIGSKLGDLYSERINADYRMNKRNVEDKNTATLLVALGRTMLQLLDSCLIEPRRSNVVTAIIEYEERIKS